MGVEPSTTGIKLEFCDKDGNTVDSHAGPAAQLFSQPRPENPSAGTDDAEYGSTDWLTDVLVAETPENLLNFRPSALAHSATSGSSKGVQVHWHKTENAPLPETATVRTLKNQLTIAYGTPIPGGRLSVDKIKVLPPETDMKPGHPLWDDWVKQTNF